MSLPNITAPHYSLVLPSTKKTIKYRPYTVKEQSILLMASESGSLNDIVEATKQICDACIVDFPGTKKPSSTMTSFDLQYFFINLRARSVDEKITQHYKCNKEECDAVTPVVIDLNKVEVIVPEGHSNTIKVTDKIGISLNYPSLNSSKVLSQMEGDDKKTQFELLVDLLVNDIQYVYDGDQIFEDFSKEELRTFIESLSLTSLDKIIHFYSTIPYVSYKIDFVCKNCGSTDKIELRGIEDFFG